MPETALVSLRTLTYFFPLVRYTFSSPLSMPLEPFRLLITAHDWRQKFVIEISDRLQLWITGH